MIKNNAVFTLEDLYVNFGPECLHNLKSDDSFTSVYIDSRSVTENSIFLALQGEKSDGHTYINKAFEQGAGIVVAEKAWYSKHSSEFEGKAFLIVDSTEKALGELAKIHRERFTTPVVAVAGSNGKTTTKDLIASILSQKFNTLKTYKNFNNQLGVPLMLLSLDETHDVAVIEIATNSPGEIAYLSEITAPTHGVVTNIGMEHLELLNDLNGVEMEETALYHYLIRQNGMAFVNMDDDRLSRYTKLLRKRVSYGVEDHNGNLKCTLLSEDNFTSSMKIEFEEISLEANIALKGYAAQINAACAASVGFAMHLDASEIKDGLEAFTNSSDETYGRMKIMKAGELTIINDTYNANPSSTINALDTLNAMKCEGKKVIVFGDMLELGAVSTIEHKRIAEIAIESSQYCYFIGQEYTKALGDKAYKSKEKINSVLESIIKPGDIVLVKGSRGMRMEDIVSKLSTR